MADGVKYHFLCPTLALLPLVESHSPETVSTAATGIFSQLVLVTTQPIGLSKGWLSLDHLAPFLPDQELTSAYDTLMDPKRRAALDQATAGAYAGAGYNSYTGGFPNFNQSHWTKSVVVSVFSKMLELDRF